MKLYAIVIGRKPKYEPYVAYLEQHPRTLAIFETRSSAERYKFEHQIKSGRVVRFDSKES